ncbi:MAG TPA: tetratricopeptide repeat protein [Phycisphaerae bacterium]|nr:tetratricopeptide repeat protein [Phycisphaerae bacterium]
MATAISWHGCLLTALLPVVAGAELSPLGAPEHPAIRTQSVELHYRIAPETTPLIKVDLWYTTDDGRSWWHYGPDADCTPPVIFRAPGEGLYGFYIVAANRAGCSSGPPQPGMPPQSSCLVDLTPPVVQFHGAAKKTDFKTTRSVQLKWSAYDGHLASKPVTVYYQTPDQTTWQSAESALPNSGHYEWHAPPELVGAISLKLSVSDMAGNVTEQVWSQLTIDPPAGAQREPATSQPVAQTPPKPPQEPVEPPDADIAEPARRKVELATWHLVRGEYDVAAERFREALQLDPTLVDARNDLAGILYKQERYDRALSEYQRALALDPAHTQALEGLALTYMQRHEPDLAQAALQKMLLSTPDDPEVWLNLGDLALKMNQRTRARTCWEKAAQLSSPGSPTVTRARQRLNAYAARR